MTSEPRTYVQHDQTLATTEYQSRTHYEEFIKVVNSLGVVWDSIKHPRDRLGRFIRTFSDVEFTLPGSRGNHSGKVISVDEDGTSQVEVQGIDPSAPNPLGLKEGDVIRLKNKSLAVQVIKAKLTGPGAAGKLNVSNDLPPVNKAIETLTRLKMAKEAKELTEIRDIAMEDFDAGDPAAQERKDSAIERFRDLAVKLDNIRGEGFDEGTDLAKVEGTLTPEERDVVNSLGTVIDVTFRARHALGDKTLDETDAEGAAIKGKQSEVRMGLAQNQIKANFDQGKTLWDATGPTVTKSQLAEPEKIAVLDDARPDAAPDQNVFDKLIRTSFAKYRSGLDRSAGYKQQQRAAPGARYHVDKNGDRVILGSTVVLDANEQKGRPEEVMGQVVRISYDKQSKKTTMIVREFDPEYKYGNKSSTGKPLPYIDRKGVPSPTIELADDQHQNPMFVNLALQGKTKVIEEMSKVLLEDTIATLQDQAGRRLAETGAKRISPTGAVDAIPIHARVKKDKFDESLTIGDSVITPNGLTGTLIYAEPNTNQTRVMLPDGSITRPAASMLQRAHGPSSEVFPGGDRGFTDPGYIPTREESAADADAVGATQLAEAIRADGDWTAIQTAMATDQAFQDNVMAKADELYDRIEQTRSTGGNISPEDQEELARLNRFAAASVADFRDPGPPPKPPEPVKPPEPESDGERPQNPMNSEQEVTEGGVTVREDEESGETIVDENVEDPIDSSDTEAVEEAITQAEGEKGTETPPEEEPSAVVSEAEKMNSILQGFGEEAMAQAKNNIQREQIRQGLDRISQAIADRDGPALVSQVQELTKRVNANVNANLKGSKLHAMLTGISPTGERKLNRPPLAQILQAKLDAGADLFGTPSPVTRQERVPEVPDETPEGVDPATDALDNAVSEALLADDGTMKVLRDGEEVDEGFYVVDRNTITEFDSIPTQQDLADFLNETQSSSQPDVSIWFDEADGRYRMARVGVYDTEEEAAGAASAGETNQYVNIADGAVMNLSLGSDQNLPPEAVEDPRSEERAVRVAGTGKASARSTAKQKNLLDHVSETSGDEEIGRIATAIKNGEEINGADASRLADAIDGMGADQFDKPSDKGVASQMAHKLARAAGEEGARGYSSQNTALRRSSDVGISLSAQSQDDTIRGLVDDARTDIKNGDTAAAAAKYREAADAFDALNLPNDAPAKRAREHADRLDAMGGVTAPAPEGAPPAPEPGAETPPPPEAPQQGAVTAREALDSAGLPEVEPLTQSQFSNPETPRTRQVTPAEYTALALRGKDRLDGMLDDPQIPAALGGETWSEIQAQAWDAVQEEWGGITVDAHTGQLVVGGGDQDQFAITFRPPGVDTVSVPIGSSREDFDAAMERAVAEFGGEQDLPLWAENAHLGVFRNDDTGMYEIDPVLVFDNLDDVEAVGAYSGSEGGAYNFKDGLGYWPPYVAEEEAGGGAGEEGVPGARRLESPSPEGGEAEPGVPPEEQAPEGSAGVGQEALEVGASPTETLNNLFDRIGEPGDYGTEHQGRMLGEARALATEGLTDEAADRLETAAASAPEGSDDKRLMLEAAQALRGGEAPPGGGGGEAGGPDAAEVESALSTVDDAIDSEVNAEGDNGPQGHTDVTDEAGNQLGLIRGRVTAEGPYTELSQDLRDLAQYMEDNWTLSDPSGTVQELRDTADALDGTGPGAPQGGTPGEEGGGGAPFRLDPSDPAAIRDLVVTPEFKTKRDQALADYFEALGKIDDKISQGIEKDSIAGQLINDRLLEAETKYSDESRLWSAMRRRGDDLSPEQVSMLLNGYNDQTVADVLDLWSNFDAQVDPDLASGDINQILGEQVVSAASEAKAAVDKLYAEPWNDTAHKRAGSAKSYPSNVERSMRPSNRIETTDEFVNMLPEVAATAEDTMSLRDPEVRSTMGPMALMHATDSARRLTNDIAAAKTMFDHLRTSGVDPAPLESVLREQLDKYEMGDLLSMDDYPPIEIRQKADQALLKFRQAEDTGKSAEKESVALVNQIAIQMANSGSAGGHGTYASVLDQAVTYQRGHGGVSPALAAAVKKASAHDRFGFMHSTLTGLDLDLAVREGDAEKVSALTNGTHALVVWGNETTLSPDLVADDRSGTETETGVIANIMFREGMEEITPNVAAALNSMYAAYGGSIHRTDTNITEANHPVAEAWKAPGGWNRGGDTMDDRTPEQVSGVYTGHANVLIVADTTFQWSGDVANTVTHELGHALDSMIGEVTGLPDFYSRKDPGFDAFRTKLMEIASYGDSPDDTTLSWYYRNKDEGSAEHNGYAGHSESWAQGYAAYGAMRRMLENPEEGSEEGYWDKVVYRKGGRTMLHGHNSRAQEHGVTLKDTLDKHQAAGQAIYEYFDDFENNILPEIMKTPVAVKKRVPPPNALSQALGQPVRPKRLESDTPLGLVEGGVVTDIYVPGVEAPPAESAPQEE